MCVQQWDKTLYTYIIMFNTGRGLSVFLRLPHNIGFIYDMGASEVFSPRRFIETKIAPTLSKFVDEFGNKRALAQLIISHPHADHISEIIGSSGAQPVDAKFPDAALVTCPHNKDYPPAIAATYRNEKADFRRVNNPASTRQLVDSYLRMIQDRTLPLQTIGSANVTVPNLEYGIYYVRPPACNSLYPSDDQKYTNSLSLVLYLRHGNQSILIPGDITPEAFEKILNCDGDVERRYTNFSSNSDRDSCRKTTGTQPKLGHLLTKYGLSILITPHHGLKSGFCSALYNRIYGGKPDLNLISERRGTQEEADRVHSHYQGREGAKSLTINIDGAVAQRWSASTINNHHILVVFKGTDIRPHVFLRKNPEDLLAIVP